MDVSRLDVNLQDAVVRLVRLLDSPAEVPVLMPLIKREIVYRLLMGIRAPGSASWQSREVTPRISPERSSGSGRISTSRCRSRSLRASWA